MPGLELHILGLASSPWMQTLGRLHVVAVHLPIGLLLLAGVIELWRGILRKPGISPVSLSCLVFGAIGAGVAAGLGWIHKHFSTFSGEQALVLDRHQTLGFITVGVAIVTAIVALVLRKRQGQAWAYRFGAIACAALVGIVGHFGGELTHGTGYLTELLTNPQIAQGIAKPQASTAPVVKAVHFPADGKIAFARDVEPIFAQSCYECHSVSKTRGNLRLDSAAGIASGGKSGPVLVAHEPANSLLMQRVLGEGGKKRMPVDHDPLPEEQIKILRVWIEQGGGGAKDAAPVEKYVAPLQPRRPNVPDASAELSNPIDRILAPYLEKHQIKSKPPVDDRTYVRRVYIDVIGLLPTPEQIATFSSDTRPNKRELLVEQLLADNEGYAENFLTFWNDALRNDYRGPGYIDGGRKQILAWLYGALESNLAYDKFVQQLIDPTPQSEGFIKGIIWRGAVSASQGREIQAAQNISQVFLGLNMKCNSCHDSFISDWKLVDAYGLAGVFADKPMEMFRCEKATGEIAPIRFIYPQLGSIDSAAPKAERVKQLARIMTSKENGRLTRTMVNRLWARFMGRGLVEPLDEMDHAPWNADLLDWLAVDLADNGFDLKKTIARILTSRAYQMPAVGANEIEDGPFIFAGPTIRRMLAEQYCDALSSLSGVWQGQPASPEALAMPRFLPQAKWIWNDPEALSATPAAKVFFRKEIDLPELPTEALAAGTADNHFTLFVNGKKAGAGTLGKPVVIDLKKHLIAGKNVITVVAINDWLPAKGQPTTSPSNPAGLWIQASVCVKSKTIGFGTDGTWQWSATEDAGAVWKSAAELGPVGAGPWNLPESLGNLKQPYTVKLERTRAVWANADALMIALGRPNRERPVTYRPSAATMLQALELTNGAQMSSILQRGAQRWLDRKFTTTNELVDHMYQDALGRKPTAQEQQAAEELVGSPARSEGVEDLLWSLVMLPEFQLIY